MMNLTTDTTTLRAAVSWAAQGLRPGRSAEPAHVAMRLEAGADGVSLSAFDGDRAATAVAAAAVAEPGDVLLPGWLLDSILRELTAARPLRISEEKDGRVQIASGRSVFDLVPLVLDAGYPLLPDLPAAAGVIDGDELAGMVRRVIVAMSKTPEKPCFEGVRIEAGETLRMVASDGWRIAIREVPWQRCGVDDVPPVLFPPAVLEAMARAVPAGSKVTYCTGPDEGGQGMAGFSCDGQTLVTRTLVSPYPEYGGWVSAERPCFADMDSQALLGAVRRASLMMAPGSGVRLTFYETSASAEAANADAASATETFEVTFSGDEPLKVVLNPEYLKDAVSTVDRDRVRMSFPVAERNSVKLTAPGDGEAADCHLVVPIKVPQPGQ